MCRGRASEGNYNLLTFESKLRYCQVPLQLRSRTWVHRIVVQPLRESLHDSTPIARAPLGKGMACQIAVAGRRRKAPPLKAQKGVSENRGP